MIKSLTNLSINNLNHKVKGQCDKVKKSPYNPICNEKKNFLLSLLSHEPVINE